MISALPILAETPEQIYSVLPHSKFLEMLNKSLNEPQEEEVHSKEVIYRKHSKQIERINYYDKTTAIKVRTEYYDYFNDKKIKSIDEFDKNTGEKICTTNFTLFKSVTEYNRKTGKKLKTINYSIRDENKVASIHEYHHIYDKVTRISIFCPDGKSVSMVKEINPLTERVEQCINYKRNSNVVSSVSKYEFQNNKMVKTTCYYTDHTKSIQEFNTPAVTKEEKEKNAKLIDNLFGKNLEFKAFRL